MKCIAEDHTINKVVNPDLVPKAKRLVLESHWVKRGTLFDGSVKKAIGTQKKPCR